MNDFIPLIKFSKITSEDFHYKVRPHKAIIPNNAYEKAITFYLVEQPKLFRESEKERKRDNQIESDIIKPY